MIQKQYPVEELIPHRDRMELIGTLIEIDDDHCVTQSLASSQWPLCDGKQINSIIIVELVAQTASAFAGWQKRDKEKTGGEGVIVGIKKAVLTVPAIPVGTSLTTSCSLIVNLDDQYAEFEGEVKDEHTSYGRVVLQTFSVRAMMSKRDGKVP